jgi:anti-anti-sigma factor
MSAASGQLEVRASTDDGVATVAVDGELDIATVSVLEGALSDVERGEAATLTLDLGGVGFMDSTGLRALLSARKRAAHAGRALQLANIPPPVARVFDLTGAGRLFEVGLRA